MVTYFGEVLGLQHGGIGTAASLEGLQVDPLRLLTSWQQWDANWYVRIATQGYHIPASAAFFPVYPLLMHGLASLAPGVPVVAWGMLISNASLLVALTLLLRLAQRDFQIESGRQAALLLLAYPGAFFLAAAYTESLLLALMVGAFLAMRTHHWILALGLAVAATLTAAPGFLIALPMAWEIFRGASSWKQTILRLTTLAPIPLAMVAFALYIGRRLGDPLLVLHAHSLYWLHTLNPIRGLPLALYRLIQFPPSNYVVARNLVDVVPVLLAIVALVFAARVLPVSYVLLAAAMLVLFVVEPLRSLFPLASDLRRVMAIFPLFLAAGFWLQRRPAWQPTVFFVFLPMQAILLLLYLQHSYIV